MADIYAIPAVRGVVLGTVILVWCLLNFYIALYMERKLAGFFQNRLGLMRVGPYGLLQPMADLLKLLQKEVLTPRNVDKWVFVISPYIAFIPAVLIWLVVPFGQYVGGDGKVVTMVVADYDIGIILISAILAYDVIAVFMAGWGSNNKYSLIGAMRGAAQMISYEVTMVMSVIGVVMMTAPVGIAGEAGFGSLQLSRIVAAQAERGVLGWYVFPQFIGFIVFVIASLAELQRAPFDLTEAESELVSGYHTEYSGFQWAAYALTEYVHLVAWSAIAATLFLGGFAGPSPADMPFIGQFFEWMRTPLWQGFWGIFWLMFKTYLFVFFAMWARWTLPRVRIDQLMDLGWKFLLPVSLFNILLTGVMRYGWTVFREDSGPISWLFWLWR